MFYVTLILIAGYILFFTDSIILFFFAYEMLLIPSFFILYNYAKTRRCVEAAYLMFFLNSVWSSFFNFWVFVSFFLFVGHHRLQLLHYTISQLAKSIFY